MNPLDAQSNPAMRMSALGFPAFGDGIALLETLKGPDSRMCEDLSLARGGKHATKQEIKSDSQHQLFQYRLM